MAQQCIWASAPGRTGNVHVSESGYKVQSSAQYDRAAVCDACGQAVGVFIAGTWFYVLRMRGGRVGYTEAPFTLFGDSGGSNKESGSSVLEKKVRV